MSIKQAIEALECAQDALDISQSLQESAKSNHHPKTLAAYERVSAALAALRSMPQGEPVATIRYERGTPGKENDMPKVVSCNWLPDGVYSVYATPHTEAVRMSEAEIDKVLEPWAFKNLNAYPHCYDAARAVEQATAARLGVQLGEKA